MSNRNVVLIRDEGCKVYFSMFYDIFEAYRANPIGIDKTPMIQGKLCSDGGVLIRDHQTFTRMRLP